MRKYSLATSTWDNAEVDAIQKVIESDMFTMGPKVKEFEAAFAEFVGSNYCVMVNSGSSANLLAVAALFYRKSNRLKRGDEVIVPAVSWATTYYPLYQYGLKIKFVDVDKNTLNFDLEALKAAISDNTKMIFAVNLLGNSNDFTTIRSIIGEKDIILIEDNCESLGAELDGKQTGTFGLMGTYSSFFSHHISTMEGGMVVTDDEELYHILLSTRSHGWTRHLPKENLVCGTKSDDPFEESFRFVLPGYNLRPLEMSGALGLEQLKKLPNFIKVRRKNAALFYELFKNNPYFYIQEELGNSSWFGFSLIIKEDASFNRKDLINYLEENAIESRPIVTGNFAKNEVVEWFDYEIFGSLKNADLVDENGFFVGNSQEDLTEELNYFKEVIDRFLNIINE